MNLGEFFKQKRNEAGLRQLEAALKIGYANENHLSRIERGLAPVPRKVIKKLFEAYSVSEEDRKKVLDFIIEEIKAEIYGN